MIAHVIALALAFGAGGLLWKVFYEFRDRH